MNKLLVVILFLLSSLSFANPDNSLVYSIKQTNLLEMKERPQIKFIATVKIGKTMICSKSRHGKLLIVSINPHHWYAQSELSQVYEFCQTMNKCDERITCPSLRSYNKKS